MDATSKNLSKANDTEEKNSAQAKTSRGLSLRACVAKAVGWTLKKATALPIQEACIHKTL